MVDDLAYQPEHRGLLDTLEIVEEQHEAVIVIGEPGDQVQGRIACRASVVARCRFAGRDRQEIGDGRFQTGQETLDIVVGLIEREPGGARAVGGQLFQALGHERGLAEARRTLKQDHFHGAIGLQGRADLAAQQLCRVHGGRVELAGQRACRRAATVGRDHVVSFRRRMRPLVRRPVCPRVAAGWRGPESTSCASWTEP